MKLGHRVSAYDFVRAMLLAGFRLTRSADGFAVLEKNDVRLFVPQVEVMKEEVIESLLLHGNVPGHLFMMYLNRLGSRDTVPEQSEVVSSNPGR